MLDVIVRMPYIRSINNGAQQMTQQIKTEAAALAASKGYAASKITKINFAADGSLASIELGVDADGFGIFVLNFAL